MCDLIKVFHMGLHCLTLHVINEMLNFLHNNSLQFETEDSNSSNDQNNKSAFE